MDCLGFGGYPHAELHNQGNAPTTISLEVLSLPQGWQVSGPTQVVIGVGEITGVPLEVIPSSDWEVILEQSEFWHKMKPAIREKSLSTHNMKTTLGHPHQ